MKENLQFSERLEALLLKRGITPSKLGKEVGLSHVAIGNFLKGQVPKSEHLYAIARYFEVSMEWLLCGKNVPLSDKEQKAFPPASQIKPGHEKIDLHVQKTLLDALRAQALWEHRDLENLIVYILIQYLRQQQAAGDKPPQELPPATSSKAPSESRLPVPETDA